MGQEKMNTTLATISVPVTIGIDIAKLHLDVHVLPERLVRPFSNDPDGIAALIAWITPMRPGRIVFEATGAYHHRLERALHHEGLPSVKINPLQARRFAQASGTRAKTDPVDAAMLARFGATLQPDIAPARDPAIDDLQELHTARRALVKDRTAALNRGKTLSLDLLKQHNQQQLAQINAQIAAIEREMLKRQAAHARLQRRLTILLSIPGLGAITASALLIEMPELGTLDPKQAASLAGLAPITRQSGAWQGKSFIQGGRAGLRHALYMPALVAIRFNPDLKVKYQALRQAGKPAKVALVAVMRKLLLLANALLRDDRLWGKQAPGMTL
jgi:transposase